MSFLVIINAESVIGKILSTDKAAYDILVRDDERALHPALYCDSLKPAGDGFLRVERIQPAPEKPHECLALVLPHSSISAIVPFEGQKDLPLWFANNHQGTPALAKDVKFSFPT